MSAPKPAVVDQATLEWEGRRGRGPRHRQGDSLEGCSSPASGREAKASSSGIAEVAPGSELMRHHHEPAETITIISGRGEMEIEGHTQAIGPGSAVYIPPDAHHAVRCTGDEPTGLRLLLPARPLRPDRLPLRSLTRRTMVRFPAGESRARIAPCDGRARRPHFHFTSSACPAQTHFSHLILT